ncbi:MBL fold metallo-hydrolase [Novosphingobium sp.]|uniref:MBL fold metallo-hydrolase n=1 Tax=Novosphingobium sp. TaxID=1874826 RepID=UPI0031D49925
MRTAGRRVATAVALVHAGLAGAAPTDDLTRPIAQELAPLWLDPVGPIGVHGNTWLVGFTRMNVVLIASDAGLILIDAGLPQAAPLVEKSLNEAGFRIQDVRYILSSEPHYDHAGGLAALARDSGATVLASRAGARVLRAGIAGWKIRSGPVCLPIRRCAGFALSVMGRSSGLGMSPSPRMPRRSTRPAA